MALIRAQVYSQRHPGPNKFVVEPAYAGFFKPRQDPVNVGRPGPASTGKKRRVFANPVT